MLGEVVGIGHAQRKDCRGSFLLCTAMTPRCLKDDIGDGVLICRVRDAALNPSEIAHFRIRIRLISASHPFNGDLRGKG